MRLALAGEDLLLDAGRALVWPRRGLLMVADVHLGKGAVFRRAGLAIPEGGTRGDLSALAGLIRRHAPARLLVLGDLFHDRLDDAEPWRADFDAFRAAHAGLQIQVVQGNHDRATARVPSDWRLEWLAPGHVEPPFVLRHEPADDPRGYVLAGHVHPVIGLRTRLGAVRLPVFWFGAAQGVLPSFGAFTGGYRVRPAPGDRVIAAAPDGLVEIPARARRGA